MNRTQSTRTGRAKKTAGTVGIRYAELSEAPVEVLAPISTTETATVGRWQISRTELTRRLWHIAPGLLPFVSWSYPHKDPLSPTFKLIALGIVIVLAVTLAIRYHTVARAGERHGFAGILGYACSIVFTLLLFPAHAELAMTVVAVLAFGDGMATLGGLLLRGRRLPWNADKTWAGSICFVVFGAPMGALAYLAESQPTAPVLSALICGATAALAAAIAESLPVKLNDNIRVGVTAAVTVALMHGWVVGWS